MSKGYKKFFGGTLGASIGGAGSYAALYGLGTTGVSAAGLTSGLAAAGSVIGGGMLVGVFVLAAPVVALAVGGVEIASRLKDNSTDEQCHQTK